MPPLPESSFIRAKAFLNAKLSVIFSFLKREMLEEMCLLFSLEPSNAEVSANYCDNKVINVILSSFAQFFTSFQIGVFCILLFVNIIINPPNFNNYKEMSIPIAKI